MSIKQQPRRAWLWMQKHWFVSGMALLIGSCAFMSRDRTVTWEEEVPLNTGETIVVKRSGSYSFGYSAGDGYIGFSPNPISTIEFTYKGKKYVHTGNISFNLVAIGLDGMPSLVADARGWGNYNKYPCVTPYYVQFKTSKDGSQWFWPNQIEPWLYNVPTNLIVGLAAIDDDGKILSSKDRQRLNGSLLPFDDFKKIEPSKKPENCMRNN